MFQRIQSKYLNIINNIKTTKNVPQQNSITITYTHIFSLFLSLSLTHILTHTRTQTPIKYNQRQTVIIDQARWEMYGERFLLFSKKELDFYVQT